LPTSSEPAIRASRLGKRYRLQREGAGYKTLRETLMSAARRPFGARTGPAAGADLLWAVRDVSFDVARGDVVGVIGRNGAGKSTLLKVLSRITRPTEGWAEIRGRVGSLLEVGTGFNRELTGRENVFLSGAILGMKKAGIARQLDAIVAFAEVDEFVDVPVKHYSSGMYTRLAFAVAAHLEPEVLLIDEVLAVGDVAFQRKCLTKMEGVAREGRTVLFVSHNMTAISSLCRRVVLFTDGRAQEFDDVRDGVRAYLADSDVSRQMWSGDEGDDVLRLRRTWVRADGAPADALESHFEIVVGLAVSILRPVSGLVVGVHVCSQRGYELGFSEAHDRDERVPDTVTPGDYVFEVSIPPDTFAQGVYTLRFNVGVHNQRRVPPDVGTLTVSVNNTQGIGRHYITGRGLQDIFRPSWVWRRRAKG
jgi:lipopolysaccharide transport system ATP-binding protein